jgi:hypothetical protein
MSDPNCVCISHDRIRRGVFKLIDHDLTPEDASLAYLPLAQVLEFLVEMSMFFVGEKFLARQDIDRHICTELVYPSPSNTLHLRRPSHPIVPQASHRLSINDCRTVVHAVSHRPHPGSQSVRLVHCVIHPSTVPTASSSSWRTQPTRPAMFVNRSACVQTESAIVSATALHHSSASNLLTMPNAHHLPCPATSTVSQPHQALGTQRSPPAIRRHSRRPPCPRLQRPTQQQRRQSRQHAIVIAGPIACRSESSTHARRYR